MSDPLLSPRRDEVGRRGIEQHLVALDGPAEHSAADQHDAEERRLLGRRPASPWARAHHVVDLHLAGAQEPMGSQPPHDRARLFK
jgi:hypothetical protein